jgi:hypothetical protein
MRPDFPHQGVGEAFEVFDSLATDIGFVVRRLKGAMWIVLLQALKLGTLMVQFSERGQLGWVIRKPVM